VAPQAEASFKSITAQRNLIVTTTFILLECGNTAARRPYRAKIGALRRTLEQRQEVIVPDESDWDLAWAAYDRGEAGQAGIIDQVSFIVMRRLGLTQAFTNDLHFQAAGFTTLF
jgi:predicted nucleic acid-binding protein